MKRERNKSRAAGVKRSFESRKRLRVSGIRPWGRVKVVSGNSNPAGIHIRNPPDRKTLSSTDARTVPTANAGSVASADAWSIATSDPARTGQRTSGRRSRIDLRSQIPDVRALLLEEETSSAHTRAAGDLILKRSLNQRVPARGILKVTINKCFGRLRAQDQNVALSMRRLHIPGLDGRSLAGNHRNILVRDDSHPAASWTKNGRTCEGLTSRDATSRTSGRLGR